MIDWLNAWWATISGFEKIFWFIAVPFSVLTLIQLILQLIGMVDFDVNTDLDGHVDAGHLGGHHSFSASGIFSVRTLIIFLTVFGWMGIACSRAGIPKFFTVLLALMVGLLAMVLVAWIFYSLYKLSESGTMNLENTIGLSGSVYLTIPAKRSGKGKVQLVVQGATQEIDAITYDQEDYKTGMNVTVIEKIDDNTVLVTRALTFH